MTTNRQLPSHMVAKEFGEVNVRRGSHNIEVMFTIAMEPGGDMAEGWQTGVALDGSASMREWYGQTLKGTLPPNIMSEYEAKGWITTRVEDGHSLKMVQSVAYDDAIKRGFLRFSDNVMEPMSREFITYLADQLDEDGGTTVIYWACGDGSATEVLGDFTGEQCKTIKLSGPTKAGFGKGTMLVPAMRYFLERFRDAERGMYVFLTDGRVDDLDAVKRTTKELAQQIQSGQRKSVKCVLIGVGDEIDEAQMEELDDLDTGTDVDIWDHKIAKDMRSLVEIFAEVVDENQIVAPTGKIYDASGNVVKSFSDGLPAKVTFTMPAASAWFELDVEGERVRQSILES